jgi:hypothetical protein
MTEYELADLMNGMTSNIAAAQAIFLSVLFAYLIVAYTTGKSLTRYQVAFINFVFILMASLGTFSQMNNLVVISEWGVESTRLRGVEGMREEMTFVAKSVFILIRVFLVLGALVFMWQVRHPKTE